jgi:hypothetical protein
VRLTVTLFAAPVKVGVEPTTAPEADATVRLCSTGAWLVKAIVTLPAFALSVEGMYLNWPSGLAATAIVSAPAAGTLVVLAELVVAGVAAVVAGADVAELVLLEELPQPASASRARASANIESASGEEFFARPAIFGFTAGSPIFGA